MGRWGSLLRVVWTGFLVGSLCVSHIMDFPYPPLVPLQSMVGLQSYNTILYSNCTPPLTAEDLVTVQENVSSVFTVTGNSGTGDYGWQVNVYTNDTHLAFQQIMTVASYVVGPLKSEGYFFLEDLYNGGYYGQPRHPNSTIYPDNSSVSVVTTASEVTYSQNLSDLGLYTFYWNVYVGGEYQVTYFVTAHYRNDSFEEGVQSILVGAYPNGSSSSVPANTFFSGAAGDFAYTSAFNMSTEMVGGSNGNTCSNTGWHSTETSNVNYSYPLYGCQAVVTLSGEPPDWVCYQRYYS